MFFPQLLSKFEMQNSQTPPGGRSITTHDLKLVFLSAVTVLQTENNKWKIMYPKDPITERQMMIGVYNHLRNERYFSVPLSFSEGDWIPRGSWMWDVVPDKKHVEKGGLGMEPWTPAPRKYVADLWLVS